MDVVQVTDQAQRTVSIRVNPARIISLVPSQTELLFDLGVGDRVVGCTKFCVHPAQNVRRIPKIGGTKTINTEAVSALKPDLIIANKEENTKEIVEMLARQHPVWVSDVKTLEDNYRLITQLGTILDVAGKAIEMVEAIRNKMELIPSFHGQKALYFIWRSPLMVAGKDTFIHSILEKLGIQNLINENRYPVLSEKDAASVTPDHVFLSSEPYPFREKHLDEFRFLFPGAVVTLVDGEMFSWFGSRMLRASNYFSHLATRLG